MSSYKWDELNLVVRDSIYVQPDDDRKGHKRCGCFSYVLVSAGVAHWDLCQYHEGMNDGADDVEAEVERLTAELAAEKIHAVEATNVIIEAQAEIDRLTTLGNALCDAARGVLAPNDNDIESDCGLPDACDAWEGR